jgi:hypothetical protein
MAEYTITAADGKKYVVDAPEGLPPDLVRDDLNRQLRRQELRSRPAAAPAPVERTLMGQLGEGLRGIPRGAIGLLETAGIGASAMLPDEEEAYLRDLISGAAESAASPFQRKAGYEDSMAGTFGEAVGSFVPFLAAGPFGMAGRVAAAGVAGSAGAGTARERAEQGGATPEERAKATLLGSAVGLSEVLVPFRILDDAIGGVSAVGIINRGKRALATGGVEGAQEAAAEVAQNLISKGIYDPEQGVFTGTGESFGYGAGVGGLVQGLTDLFVKTRSTGGAPAPAAEEQAAEVPPPPPAPPLRTVNIPVSMTGGGENGVMRLVQEPSGKLFSELVDPAGAVRMRQPLSAASPNAFLDEMGKLEVAAKPVDIKTIVDAITKASTVTRAPEQQGMFDTAEAPVSGAAPKPSLTSEEVGTQARTAEIARLRESMDRTNQQKRAVSFLRTRVNSGSPEQSASAKRQLVELEKTKVLSDAQMETAARRIAALESGAPSGTRQELEGAGQLTLEGAAGARAQEAALAAQQKQAGDLSPAELEAATSDDQMVAKAMARQQAREENDLALRDEDAEAADSQRQRQGALQFSGSRDADTAANTTMLDKLKPIADKMRRQTEFEKAQQQAAEEVDAQRDTIAQKSVNARTVFDANKTIEDARNAELFTPPTEAGLTAAAPGVAQEVSAAVTALVEQAAPVEAEVELPRRSQIKNLVQSAAKEVGLVLRPDQLTSITNRAVGQSSERREGFIREEVDAIAPRSAVKDRAEQVELAVAESAPAEPTAVVEPATPLTKEEQAFRTKLTRAIGGANKIKLAQAFQDVVKKAPPTDVTGAIAQFSLPEQVAIYNEYASSQGRSEIELPGKFNAVQPKREEAASIPANQRITQMVEKGATPAQILRAIVKDKDLPQDLRGIASEMLRVAPNIDVPVISKRFEAVDEVGEYVHPSKGDEAIYLDPRAESAAQTFVHEFIHAATVDGIARNKPAGRRLVEMYEAYKAAAPEADNYGFENVYEFVAEALTNPTFQAELKSRNRAGTKKSYWDSFVDFVKNILGIQQRSTLEEILDLTKDLAVGQNQVWQNASEYDALVVGAAEQALTDQTPAANVRFLNVQGQQLKQASTPVKAPKFKRAVATLFDKGQTGITKAMVWGLGLNQINDYVQSYVKKKGPAYEPFAASFGRFAEIAGKLEGEMQQFIGSITAQIARMGDWRKLHPELYEDMNALVYGGTLGKVDLTKPKSTYAGKPEQLKEYERLEKVLKKLEPSGGAAIYKQMRAIYNRVFNGITQQVYDRVFSETQNADLATTIKNKFTEQMKLSGLEGYAALTRSNGEYRIKYSLPGSDQQYFETFENSADWKARQQQLLTEDGVSEGDMTPFLHGDTGAFDGIVPTSFMGDLVQTLKDKGAKDDLLQAVMELGISVSPAQVVMERLAKRKETPGYTLDAFAAFQESVVGLQRKLINMKYSAQMSKEVRDMRATRSNVKIDPNVKLLIDEAASRAEYAANPNQNLLSNVLTTGTYGWTLGLNVSSAIVDMLSLMVTGGYLSGRFKSRRKAHAALVKAGRDILGMGTTADVETMVTQGLEGAALQEAMATAGIKERDVTRRRVVPSMLNIDFNNPEQAKKYGYLRALVNAVQASGHSERFSDLEERAEFGESNIISKVAARMGFMMSTSERYKRETGLKAFYDLALAEVAKNGDPNLATKEQMEKAAREAMDMSLLLNGGSTSVTGPGFQRDNFWRVAFMYRSFAFRQMYVQAKTLYDATMNDNKAVKAAARKFGSTVLLTSGAVVGVQGMPLFGPVALLLNVLASPFVDDEEEEKFVQNMLRSNLDPLIYEGLPNALLNMNVSERGSLTDLLVRDTNLPDDASFAETVAAHFGGPVFGSLERAWRGKELIEQGQVRRGVESMIPVTMSNVLKSIRFATDGAAETLRGDDVIQISPIAVVSQFLGFTPADYARTMEFKSVQAGVDRRVAERKSNLYAAAYAAYRVGDSAGLAQIMQKMIEFNQQYPAEAIKSSDLRQSLQTRARNSEAMLGGTLPRESRRTEWQEAADDWGVVFPE